MGKKIEWFEEAKVKILSTSRFMDLDSETLAIMVATVLWDENNDIVNGNNITEENITLYEAHRIFVATYEVEGLIWPKSGYEIELMCPSPDYCDEIEKRIKKGEIK